MDKDFLEILIMQNKIIKVIAKQISILYVFDVILLGIIAAYLIFS